MVTYYEFLQKVESFLNKEEIISNEDVVSLYALKEAMDVHLRRFSLREKAVLLKERLNSGGLAKWGEHYALIKNLTFNFKDDTSAIKVFSDQREVLLDEPYYFIQDDNKINVTYGDVPLRDIRDVVGDKEISLLEDSFQLVRDCHNHFNSDVVDNRIVGVNCSEIFNFSDEGIDFKVYPSTVDDCLSSRIFVPREVIFKRFLDRNFYGNDKYDEITKRVSVEVDGVPSIYKSFVKEYVKK